MLPAHVVLVQIGTFRHVDLGQKTSEIGFVFIQYNEFAPHLTTTIQLEEIDHILGKCYNVHIIFITIFR